MAALEPEATPEAVVAAPAMRPATSLAAAEPVGSSSDPEIPTVDLKEAAKAPWRPFLPQRRWVAAGAAIAAMATLALGVRVKAGSNSVRTAPPPPGLQLSSTPPGATVLVDGAEAGITPLYLTELSVGSHSLKVVAENHAPAQLTVETTAEGPPVPLRFDLQPLQTTLQVESDPPAAALTVDDKPAGNTPLSGLRLSAGTHRIGLARAGFRRWTRVVDAQPGKALRLEAKLEPSEGTQARGALRRQGWVVVKVKVRIRESQGFEPTLQRASQ